jgi:uncharacterized protein (TIGR02145 family)
MRVVLLSVFVLHISCAILAQSEPKKVALVIGNANFNSSRSLETAINDANLMSSVLVDLGFSVTMLTDATYIQMKEALSVFSEKLTTCEVSFFYFAGYGIFENRYNNIIPVDANLPDRYSLKNEAITLEEINEIYTRNPGKNHIMVIDPGQTCWFEPISFWSKSAALKTYRFTEITGQASGSLVAFASKYVKTNWGELPFGIYTDNLVQQLKVNQSISEVFKNTKDHVIKITKGEQHPEHWSLFLQDFSIYPNSILSKRKNEFFNEEQERKKIEANQRNQKNESTEMPLSGSFTDIRDGKSYKWIIIGGKKWMAENLFFKPDSGIFSDNKSIPNPDARYGYLYDWKTANEACPKGWKLPTNADWAKLASGLGGATVAGTKLKARKGWKYHESYVNGTDDYGFNALPSGYWYNENSFSFIESVAYWWSQSDDDENNAYIWSVNSYSSEICRRNDGKKNGYAVRCVERE